MQDSMLVASRPRGPDVSRYRRYLPAIVALLLAAVVYFWSAAHVSILGLFWLFGLALGFVLQRSRFCFAGAFRDLFLLKHGHTMKGIIAGLAVATLGFSMIMATLVPNPSLGALPPDAHILPLSVAMVLGGLMFGLGMVVAGGCVTGSLYRMGEGYVASWVAIGGVLIGLFALNHSWNWWWDKSISSAPKVWLPEYLGYSGAIAGTLAVLGVAYLLILWWESRSRIPSFIPKAPEAPITDFRQRVLSLWDSIFVRGWTPIVGGVALGVINVLMYQGYHPWGVIGELSRWTTGAGDLVGLSAGPLKGMDKLAAGCVALVSEGRYAHPLMLVTGIVAGSFLAAALAVEFKVRWPRRPVRYVQALAGGLLMGYGAGLAIGCNIGAFFSAIPSLALNGWVFALTLAVGAFLGVQVIRRIP